MYLCVFSEKVLTELDYIQVQFKVLSIRRIRK